MSASLVVFDPAAPPVATGPAGVQRLPVLEIESEAYRGSLGGLLECARLRRIDLREVAIHPICEAYVAYLLEFQDRDLEVLGGALTVLAYLVERKAWAMLPVPEAEPEPLPEDTPELPVIGGFGEAIDRLFDLAAERQRFAFRAQGREAPYEMPITLGEARLGDLAAAFERVLRRAKPDVPIVVYQRRSLAEVMRHVVRDLDADFRSLDDVAPADATRTDCVWWFLALLELIRLRQARVRVVDGLARFARA